MQLANMNFNEHRYQPQRERILGESHFHRTPRSAISQNDVAEERLSTRSEWSLPISSSRRKHLHRESNEQRSCTKSPSSRTTLPKGAEGRIGSGDSEIELHFHGSRNGIELIGDWGDTSSNPARICLRTKPTCDGTSDNPRPVLGSLAFEGFEKRHSSSSETTKESICTNFSVYLAKSSQKSTKCSGKKLADKRISKQHRERKKTKKGKIADSRRLASREVKLTSEISLCDFVQVIWLFT